MSRNRGSEGMVDGYTTQFKADSFLLDLSGSHGSESIWLMVKLLSFEADYSPRLERKSWE